MAFYQFLAIFPSLLVLLSISSRVHGAGEHVKATLDNLSAQVLPQQASQLFQTMVGELYQRTLSGWQLISVCGGTLWAAWNGTWAMIWGLNRAYEVEERRPWWQLASIIVGLTLWMAMTACIAVLLVFWSAELQLHFHRGVIALRCMEWLIIIAAMSVSFAVLYRFAPDLRDAQWRWSTPGALCALVLWIGATLAGQVYFDDVSNYSRTYGHLNGVVILLLWLYFTNGAILIGGEMNSEIEKNAAGRVGPRRETSDLARTD